MKQYALIALYLGAIVAATLSVAALGPSIAILNSFLLISLDLVTRDALHEAWRGRGLVKRMTLLIGTGSLLSWLLNVSAGPIAVASFVAFAASASADTFTYTALGKRSYLVKINGSNVVSAALDSLIFPALAFGWPLLWLIVIGQFAAKVAGGAIWSIVLGQIKRRKAVAA